MDPMGTIQYIHVGGRYIPFNPAMDPSMGKKVDRWKWTKVGRGTLSGSFLGTRRGFVFVKPFWGENKTTRLVGF